MACVTAPAEVIIDRLVLTGVAEQDAPAVIAAFRSHLAALLSGPGLPPPPVASGAERHGRELAAAVARSLRRAGAA